MGHASGPTSKSAVGGHSHNGIVPLGVKHPYNAEELSGKRTYNPLLILVVNIGPVGPWPAASSQRDGRLHEAALLRFPT